MKDIDYFSEEKMCESILATFRKTLPQHLRVKFNKSAKGDGLDVLQGYRGPYNLRNDGSGDSATEDEYLGVQRIGFWYAVSKQYQWVPAAGTVFFGLTRVAQSFVGSSDWTYVYFDAATGEMIDLDESKALQSKNQKAKEYFKEGEKFFDDEKYEEAINEFKKAFDTCSTGYKEQKEFKKKLDEAVVKRATQMYVEANHLAQDKKYEEALNMYKKADKLSMDPKEHEESRDNQALMLKYIGDQCKDDGALEDAMKKYTEAYGMTKKEEILNQINDAIAVIYGKEGEKLFNEGKYEEAKDKFEMASQRTQLSFDKDKFNVWSKKVTREIEVSNVKINADLLLKAKRYAEAIIQYEIAMQKTQVPQVKENLQKIIHNTEILLKSMQEEELKEEKEAKEKSQQQSSANKTKAYDLVNKGLEQICEGNLLQMEEKLESACAKYDQAEKLFYQAASIHPFDIIFNSLLKLIVAYIQIQDYTKAKELIIKSKSFFPDKLKVFNDIQNNIESGECSIDYVKRFMQEEGTAKKDQFFSQNAKF